jgi:hypothetical protein
MICKWPRDCHHCTARIEEGDDLYIVTNVFDEREYICEWCAKAAGILCACGNRKKPEHQTCWDCLVEQQKRDGWRCECGNYKKPQYVTCYTCKTEVKQ